MKHEKQQVKDVFIGVYFPHNVMFLAMAAAVLLFFGTDFWMAVQNQA